MSCTIIWCSERPCAHAGKPLSKCGKCARYMKLVAARPARLYCPSCEEVLGLPQGGTIKLYKGLACPLDGYELVRVYRGCKNFQHLCSAVCNYSS